LSIEFDRPDEDERPGALDDVEPNRELGSRFARCDPVAEVAEHHHDVALVALPVRHVARRGRYHHLTGVEREAELAGVDGVGADRPTEHHRQAVAVLDDIALLDDVSGLESVTRHGAGAVLLIGRGGAAVEFRGPRATGGSDALLVERGQPDHAVEPEA
jgi:hypothetical protein